MKSRAFALAAVLSALVPTQSQAHGRDAEVVLRGMEIIAGAIASRRAYPEPYPVPYPVYPGPVYPGPYYDPYDPYGSYYRDRGGPWQYRGDLRYREREDFYRRRR